jgi:hypothetical protein
VQLVYASVAGSKSRIDEVGGDVLAVAAGVDARVAESAAKTDGQRLVRWVHDDACTPTIIEVELTAAAAGSFATMVSELRAAGMDDPARKYMVFADAVTYCGVAHTAADDQPGLGNANNGGIAMFARLDLGCWDTRAAMHELGHTLGAVQTSAPHATTGFHCTDEWDALCESDTSGGGPQTFDCPETEAELWDCGNDDYFHTAPAAGLFLAEHWNIADSGFLEDPDNPTDDDSYSNPSAGDVFDLLIVQSSGSGASGDFAATPFTALGTHDVGEFAGSADLTYEVPTPTAEGGPTPGVSLSYSSAAVNGMNTSRNNQPGPIGAGWSLNTASITRLLKDCNLPQAPDDKCLDGDEYSITLNGVSSRLVKVSGNSYRLASDPSWRVTKYTGGWNNDTNGDYWIVTDTAGTDYVFGFAGDAVSWVPVYDLTVCSGHSYALCDKAYEWHLQTVTDTSGNYSVYEWETERNWYNARGISTTYKREYVRSARLRSIDYTRHSGQSDDQPQARVLFNWEMPCLSGWGEAPAVPDHLTRRGETGHRAHDHDDCIVERPRPHWWSD